MPLSPQQSSQGRAQHPRPETPVPTLGSSGSLTLQAPLRRAHNAARHRLSYWITAFVFLSLQAFMTAPSPLYGLYARRDGFSSLTITLVYAAYALGVIASLLFAGHLSDQYGRRPFLLIALGLDVLSALVFIAWPQLVGLYVARVLCGLSVGVTASTATAYLTELHAAHRPPELIHRAQLLASTVTLGGLGVGALLVGQPNRPETVRGSLRVGGLGRGDHHPVVLRADPGEP